MGGGTSSGQFVIEEITGVIRLHSKPITLDRDKYELNVTAVDDGSCCLNGDLTIHTSTAVVVVFITDVNDNKPVFKDCGKYTPKISEGTANGHEVIKVSRNKKFLIKNAFFSLLCHQGVLFVFFNNFNLLEFSRFKRQTKIKV